MSVSKFIKKKMPAGLYYIGDPCYVIDEDKWDSFCHKIPRHDMLMEFEGLDVLVHDTAHGDGLYETNTMQNIAVDSGLIAILPMELAVRKRGRSWKQKPLAFENVKVENQIELEYYDGEFSITIDNSNFIQIYTNGYPCGGCGEPNCGLSSQFGDFLCPDCEEERYEELEDSDED